MKTKTLITGVALATLIGVTVAVPAKAQGISTDNCDVNLNYDISVEPKKLVLSQKGDEFYRFEPGKLFVEGKEVKLNAEQRALVDNYADSLANQVPEFVALVTDAITLASTAVNTALTPLLGDETGARVAELMDNVNERLGEVMHKDGDSYYVGVTDGSIDEVFDKEFEREIENLVQESVGTLMIKLGTEILSSEGDSFEAKMEAFGKKMEAMGEQIELEMESQSKSLEARATKVCDQFETLLVLESELRTKVPELSELEISDRKEAQLRE
ncbi:YggN family protein [Shewanella litorisediminis]|uniref:YggN family protein n=1 Tax=Shewanella litorisediminis TaxID=1173586 RepID=A0ABX7G0G5_9GAMM|nr:YggN family protein [Shewanella litorisediminis]MCL2918174.1 YggN family protein [Shewanella litorisediminis]QRH00771.1 YggN family protein [Shewanella litorisediminis]